MSASNVFFNNKQLSSQVFTSSGTFTVPDGVYEVFIDLWGAGGSGASASPIDLDLSSGHAYGGECGKRVMLPVAVTPASNITVTIGSGGAGVDDFPLQGNDGNASFFGSIKAGGGRGGSRVGVSGGVPRAGMGVGRDNVGTGGTTVIGSRIAFGGDAGFGNGGNGVIGASGQSGGIAAGGGGSITGPGSTVSGSGGNGQCAVYWKES